MEVLKKLQTLLISTIWCYCVPLISAAQEFPDLHFSHLTTKEGLSSNKTLGIYQDHSGVIWICTEDGGFNRYDGNSVKVFKNIPFDTTSVPSNNTRFITEDRQHKLWITTGRGLYYFDPATEKGETIAIHNGSANIEVWKVLCDSEGAIWLSTSVGVKEINSETKKVTSYNYDISLEPLPTDDFSILATFYEDQAKNLWIGSYHINRSEKLLQNNFFKKTSFQNHLIKDKQNRIWSVSRNGGLNEWNLTDSTFKNHYSPTDDAHVLDIETWQFKGQEYLCMSVYPIGVVLYNASTGQLKEYKHTSDAYSVASQEDRFILKDKNNRIWFASTNGIDIMDPELQYFKARYLYKDIVDTPEKYGEARAFLETKDHYYVTGFYQKGLFVYSKNWKIKNHIHRIPPNSSSVHAQEIGSMQEDAGGNIWYGTDSGFVKQTNGRYKVYLPDDLKNKKFDYNFSFRNFLERHDGKFWVRHPGKTLYLFDPVTEKFIRNYGADINGSNYKILFDKNSNLWVATGKGLYRFDSVADKLVAHWFGRPIKSEEVAVNNLRFAICDNQNILWLSSENGIIRFDPTNGQYKVIGVNEGLPEKDLFKIIEANDGILWFNTSRGVIRYDKERNIFNYYTAAHGLPFDENLFASFFSELPSGNILLGFLGGIVEWNPKEFTSHKKEFSVKILDAYIDDVRYPILNTKPTKRLIVAPGQKKITIHFGVLNYTAPALNAFYFYLEGINDTWQQNTDGNLTYYQLPPGEYTLRVKGAIDNTTMADDEDTILIEVKPYGYQTWWFKLLLMASGLSMAFIWYKVRANQIQKTAKLKADFENRMIQLEMQNLRSQMNPHFIFNSLNSINSYVVENKTHLASDYLTKFSRLIRLILENSKSETITVEKELETLKLYLLMESLRFDKKFDYFIQAQTGTDPQLIKLPTMIIQPYVENAIWHGLLHKKDRGEVNIYISKVESVLEIVIEDNGVGRKKAKEMKSKNSTDNKSYGMQITEQRIVHLNEKNNVQIIDIIDEQGNAQGTKVILLIYIDNLV